LRPDESSEHLEASPPTAVGSWWPGDVYASGAEPDYRFSLANERTFLAWIRTALALVVAGAALDAVDLSIPPTVERGLAVALVILGITSALLAWWRWAHAECAMRQAEALPRLRFGVLLSLAVATIAAVLAAFTS
jgi:putative membrane protein